MGVVSLFIKGVSITALNTVSFVNVFVIYRNLLFAFFYQGSGAIYCFRLPRVGIYFLKYSKKVRLPENDSRQTDLFLFFLSVLFSSVVQISADLMQPPDNYFNNSGLLRYPFQGKKKGII